MGGSAEGASLHARERGRRRKSLTKVEIRRILGGFVEK
jgi:hypothetical protein